jgi:lambda repressor-like predicted transcriptional regulator
VLPVSLTDARREAEKARTSTERRDALIREARAEGSSLRAIGRATGLSHTAVAKILARPLVDTGR